MATRKITVKVTPRAKKNRLGSWQGDVLKVFITAPPVDGKANAALVKFLSAEWGISQASIKIIHGETSRDKVLEIPDTVKLPLQNTLI